MKCRILKTTFTALTLLSGTLTLTNCKKEDLSVSSSLKHVEKKAALTAPVGAYNIVNSLPLGYVTDGSVDYTAQIQDAIRRYTNIVFPGFPLLINDVGLDIGSNRTITFLNGSQLIKKPTAASSYHVIRIFKATNVTLIDPFIIGDRKRHLSTTGEHGKGINIASSTNITIRNPKIYDSWGDGIYINQPEGQAICKNITISGAVLKYNRRCGITVLSAEDLEITNSYVYGVLESEGGTRPMSGINFEPNYYWQQLKAINISGFKTEHMGAEGVQIRLKHFYNAASSGKTVDIKIDRHEDKGAVLAGFLMELINTNSNPPISGTIDITNAVWRKNPRYVLYGLGWNEKNIKVNIVNPLIYDINDIALSDSETLFKINRYFNSTANYTVVQ